LVTFPAPPAAAPFPKSPKTTSTIPNGLSLKRNVSVVLGQLETGGGEVIREELLVGVFLGDFTFIEMGYWSRRDESSNNSRNGKKRNKFHLLSKVDGVGYVIELKEWQPVLWTVSLKVSEREI
jgi:hypothetical protein